MATTKISYGTATAITVTLGSLGSYAAREGTLVDNTTTLGVDYEVSGKLKMGAAVPTGDCYLLLSGSDGTQTTDPATGVDAAITVPMLDRLSSLEIGDVVPGTNLRFLGKVDCRGRAAAAVVDFVYGSVQAAFKGGLPQKWSVVVVNCTGQALDATNGNHVVNQTAITYTTA